MNYLSIFWSIFVVLSIAVVLCSKKFGMLKDTSSAPVQPYSWARVQLAWWTVIVLTCFISIMIEYHEAPELWQSTVVLLGISAVTTTVARVIDISDTENPAITRGQDGGGENFIFDILSDGSSVTVHRFQAVIFNFVFGVYFLLHVANHLGDCGAIACVNRIMPDIGSNNLILLGLSSATYAAMKVTENKSSSLSIATAASAQPVTGYSSNPSFSDATITQSPAPVISSPTNQVAAPVVAAPPDPNNPAVQVDAPTIAAPPQQPAS